MSTRKRPGSVTSVVTRAPLVPIGSLRTCTITCWPGLSSCEMSRRGTSTPPSGDDLVDVEERVLLEADVDEGRLHARQHVPHAGEVHVADDRALGALEVELDQPAVLEHADTRLGRCHGRSASPERTLPRPLLVETVRARLLGARLFRAETRARDRHQLIAHAGPSKRLADKGIRPQRALSRPCAPSSSPRCDRPPRAPAPLRGGRRRGRKPSVRPCARSRGLPTRPRRRAPPPTFPDPCPGDRSRPRSPPASSPRPPRPHALPRSAPRTGESPSGVAARSSPRTASGATNLFNQTS